MGAYQVIHKELEQYGQGLATKTEIIVLNKADALTDDVIEEKTKALKGITGKKIFVISAISREGVPQVLEALLKEIEMSQEEIERPEEAFFPG